jgi:hypothetical protein
VRDDSATRGQEATEEGKGNVGDVLAASEDEN